MLRLKKKFTPFKINLVNKKFTESRKNTLTLNNNKRKKENNRIIHFSPISNCHLKNSSMNQAELFINNPNQNPLPKNLQQRVILCIGMFFKTKFVIPQSVLKNPIYNRSNFRENVVSPQWSLLFYSNKSQESSTPLNIL